MIYFNVADYWDFAEPGKPYQVDWYFANKTLSAHTSNYWTNELGGCTRQDTYYGAPPAEDGSFPWQDSWYYINDSERGVLEIADNAPKTTRLEKILLFWYPYKHMVYKKGKEIPWGHVENFGKLFAKTWQIEIDHLRSAYLPPFPGYWSHGKQIVTYLAHLDDFTDCLGRHYTDVLKLNQMQPWGKMDRKDKSCTGCIYYLAKGMGRIAAEYLTFDKNMNLITHQMQSAAVYSGSKVLPMDALIV